MNKKQSDVDAYIPGLKTRGFTRRIVKWKMVIFGFRVKILLLYQEGVVVLNGRLKMEKQ